MADRFSHLEPADNLPASVQKAISRLRRFEHLEITGKVPAATASGEPTERALCLHCAQANERNRDVCWACFKPLQETPRGARPEADQDVELILDGTRFRSSDPTIPADIRELIDRIRREGYRPELIQEWQKKRQAQAKPTPLTEADLAAQKNRVQVIDGRYVDIIRIDEKLYKSDDPDLSAEVKELFDYIDQEGVTPALLQHLRLYGTKVKFRPFSTPKPSDGDVSFWEAARDAFKL